MEYQENVLCYEDYCRLRESVGWTNFSKEQTQAALSNSLYTVAVFENSQAVGMGRLIGDGTATGCGTARGIRRNSRYPCSP